MTTVAWQNFFVTFVAGNTTIAKSLSIVHSNDGRELLLLAAAAAAAAARDLMSMTRRAPRFDGAFDYIADTSPGFYLFLIEEGRAWESARRSCD